MNNSVPREYHHPLVNIIKSKWDGCNASIFPGLWTFQTKSMIFTTNHIHCLAFTRVRLPLGPETWDEVMTIYVLHWLITLSAPPTPPRFWSWNGSAGLHQAASGSADMKGRREGGTINFKQMICYLCRSENKLSWPVVSQKWRLFREEMCSAR